MLIKSIAEIKNVLRISNIDSDSALPDIEAAEEKYIVPVIGDALYADLQTKYDDNNLTTTEQLLLSRIQKPLAAFAYFDDLSLHHAMITDGGVRRTTTDNMPAAYRWEFDGVKEALSTKGYQGIESLYGFLESNAGSFPLWTASEAYTQRNQFLIKSGTDFSHQYHLYQPCRTYNALLSIMGDVEELYVNQLIGKDFFDSLKAETAPSIEEKLVMADIRKAIANLCIYHAVEKLPIRITDKGITMYQVHEKDPETMQQATDNLMNLAMKASYRDGQNYLTKAKKYLDSNASVSVFAAYFGSVNYSAPVDPADKVDPNYKRKFFTFIR